MLPWQEDEYYAVRILAAYFKHTTTVVDVDEQLLPVLLRHERLMEKVCGKVPKVELALFMNEHDSMKAQKDLRALFAKYPNAARGQLEAITKRLLGKEESVGVDEFVVIVSPLLDDRMQPRDWQSMVRGIPLELVPRIRELCLIPEQYFAE
jgi:hypothetical protein